MPTYLIVSNADKFSIADPLLGLNTSVLTQLSLQYPVALQSVEITAKSYYNLYIIGSYLGGDNFPRLIAYDTANPLVPALIGIRPAAFALYTGTVSLHTFRKGGQLYSTFCIPSIVVWGQFPLFDVQTYQRNFQFDPLQLIPFEPFTTSSDIVPGTWLWWGLFGIGSARRQRFARKKNLFIARTRIPSASEVGFAGYRYRANYELDVVLTGQDGVLGTAPTSISFTGPDGNGDFIGIDPFDPDVLPDPNDPNFDEIINAIRNAKIPIRTHTLDQVFSLKSDSAHIPGINGDISVNDANCWIEFPQGDPLYYAYVYYVWRERDNTQNFPNNARLVLAIYGLSIDHIPGTTHGLPVIISDRLNRDPFFITRFNGQPDQIGVSWNMAVKDGRCYIFYERSQITRKNCLAVIDVSGVSGKAVPRLIDKYEYTGDAGNCEPTWFIDPVFVDHYMFVSASLGFADNATTGSRILVYDLNDIGKNPIVKRTTSSGGGLFPTGLDVYSPDIDEEPEEEPPGEDNLAPVCDLVSPPQGSTTANQNTAITIDIYDLPLVDGAGLRPLQDITIRQSIIEIDTPSPVIPEYVFQTGLDYEVGYTGSIDPPPGQLHQAFRFTYTRNGGYPASCRIDIEVFTRDQAGNIAIVACDKFFFVQAANPDAPECSNFIPVESIVEPKNRTIEFDLTATNGIDITSVKVTVRIEAEVTTDEIAYELQAFNDPYDAESTVVELGGGGASTGPKNYHFKLIREADWPNLSTITAMVEAKDMLGTIGTCQHSFDVFLQPEQPGTEEESPECLCPIPQEELMKIFRRIVPQSYWRALEGKPGEEIFFAITKIMERACDAISRAFCELYFHIAQSAKYARGAVTISRTNASDGAVTFKGRDTGSNRLGTIVRAENGASYQFLEDAIFGAADLGPLTIQIEAIYFGYASNLYAENLITRWGDIVSDQAFTRSLYQIDSSTKPVGGKPPVLNWLAENRGQYQYEGESDADFRYRISRLPETVAPNAIMKTVNMTLVKAGFARAELIEHTERGVYCDREVTLLDPLFSIDRVAVCDYNDAERHSVVYSNSDFRGAFTVRVPDGLPSWLLKGIWSYLQKAKAAGVLAKLERPQLS